MGWTSGQTRQQQQPHEDVCTRWHARTLTRSHACTHTYIYTPKLVPNWGKKRRNWFSLRSDSCCDWDHWELRRLATGSKLLALLGKKWRGLEQWAEGGLWLVLDSLALSSRKLKWFSSVRSQWTESHPRLIQTVWFHELVLNLSTSNGLAKCGWWITKPIFWTDVFIVLIREVRCSKNSCPSVFIFVVVVSETLPKNLLKSVIQFVKGINHILRIWVWDFFPTRMIKRINWDSGGNFWAHVCSQMLWVTTTSIKCLCAFFAFCFAF